MRAAVLALAAVLLGLPGVGTAADMPGMPGMAMHAGDVKYTQEAGTYRIEFHVLPPEEFYSATEVAARHLTAGMLIVGGAPAVAVNATPAPTHHLVVHVFDRTGGAPVTAAKVQMSFQAVDAAGHATSGATRIPVVAMQAIGAGAASTHFGNNVVIAPGTYVVLVKVNDVTARFPITLEH